MKIAIAHGSVEYFEATPIGLADESYESLCGRETDRDHLRNADLRRNPKTLRGLARALSESALQCTTAAATAASAAKSKNLMPPCIPIAYIVYEQTQQ